MPWGFFEECHDHLSFAQLHGIASWFDNAFCGADATIYLSTSPYSLLTHWYQVRWLVAVMCSSPNSGTTPTLPGPLPVSKTAASQA